MREPKRLAHRQAERNKARALKQWGWDDDDAEPLLSAREPSSDLSPGSAVLSGDSGRYQF